MPYDTEIFKGARPVPYKQSLDFVQKSINPNKLYDLEVVSEFCKNYFEWVQTSKYNKLYNLELFSNLNYTHGTAQAFDFFYNTHSTKRMRCFKGDFIYHKLSWRQNRSWLYIEDDNIQTNDAVIISLPFSDSGDIHPNMERVLDRCDELGVPVFIDCAYMVMARDIEFDFNRECIKEVGFSLSKGYYGAERLRIGLRCNRQFKDDACDVMNSLSFVNVLGAHVGNEIVKHYTVDYVQDTFRDKQIKICKELNIEPSKCVIFGNADKGHELFGNYDRGTEFRRVCISSLLGNINDKVYKAE